MRRLHVWGEMQPGAKKRRTQIILCPMAMVVGQIVFLRKETLGDFAFGELSGGFQIIWGGFQSSDG